MCGVKKRLDERIDEGMLHWFSHVERMENDRIAKRVAIIHWVGRGRDGLILCRSV